MATIFTRDDALTALPAHDVDPFHELLLLPSGGGGGGGGRPLSVDAAEAAGGTFDVLSVLNDPDRFGPWLASPPHGGFNEDADGSDSSGNGGGCEDRGGGCEWRGSGGNNSGGDGVPLPAAARSPSSAPAAVAGELPAPAADLFRDASLSGCPVDLIGSPLPSLRGASPSPADWCDDLAVDSDGILFGDNGGESVCVGGCPPLAGGLWAVGVHGWGSSPLPSPEGAPPAPADMGDLAPAHVGGGGAKGVGVATDHPPGGPAAEPVANEGASSVAMAAAAVAAETTMVETAIAAAKAALVGPPRLAAAATVGVPPARSGRGDAARRSGAIGGPAATATIPAATVTGVPAPAVDNAAAASGTPPQAPRTPPPQRPPRRPKRTAKTTPADARKKRRDERASWLLRAYLVASRPGSAALALRPSAADKRALAARLRVPPTVVATWFSNRRKPPRLPKLRDYLREREVVLEVKRGTRGRPRKVSRPDRQTGAPVGGGAGGA